MGRIRTAGLVKRGEIWHIDKRVGGRRINRSTGTRDLEEAEQYLVRLLEENRQARVYGIRPARSFEEASAKFVLENQHKRSIKDDVGRLNQLMPWVGKMSLERVHSGVLQPWIKHRKKEGVSNGTINHGLKVVRRILNLAANEWIDEYGLTWLTVAPKIKLLPDNNKRLPYPLSWKEQRMLFKALPTHLANMALFAVNTGCRDREVCTLRWDWEVRVPELNTSVFIVPGDFVKNGDDRLVVLNRVALSVVDGLRGKNDSHVFSYRGHPVQRMLNGAWLRARRKVGLPQVRVHDLKHYSEFRIIPSTSIKSNGYLTPRRARLGIIKVS